MMTFPPQNAVSQEPNVVKGLVITAAHRNDPAFILEVKEHCNASYYIGSQVFFYIDN